MIDASQAYKAAITGDARRILLKSVIDIIDPDIVLGSATSSGFASFAKPEQMHDKVFALDSDYSTLELNRWLLNGGFTAIPDDPAQLQGQISGVTANLSGEDGTFAAEEWIELPFSNVSILQACSVYFPDSELEGFPVDLTVEVIQSGTAAYTETFTGNTADHVSLSGFTVTDPTAIKVTVSKWSLPGRRMRVAEIIPGVYEEWGNDIIAAFDVKQQGDVSCLSLPYGTCTLRIDNADRRFEPRNKTGIFKSLEERQGIAVSIGVLLDDGTVEYKRVGTFYQYSGGWRTGDNGLTMQWDLVDIIGLIADRKFIPPSPLPTTLAGWLQAIVAQLGSNFENAYTVDAAYASISVTANDAAAVTGKTCGEILRFACMAAGTWPRADASTGYLTAEPIWTEGGQITLDNLTSYPIMKANQDVAAIIFTLADGADTQYIVAGNAESSSSTVSVNNPFIHTTEQADTAAAMILATYGGNIIELTGRGDMSAEIGDVDTVELGGDSVASGRRIYQTFTFQNGVMQGCQSTLLQVESEATT